MLFLRKPVRRNTIPTKALAIRMPICRKVIKTNINIRCTVMLFLRKPILNGCKLRNATSLRKRGIWAISLKVVTNVGVRMYVCVSVCVCVCASVCTCVCVHSYVCTSTIIVILLRTSTIIVILLRYLLLPRYISVNNILLQVI